MQNFILLACIFFARIRKEREEGSESKERIEVERENGERGAGQIS